MNQNQEELYQELFAYRVVLQDSYENESDIIRELKHYLRDQGFSSSNIPNTLHEFYKNFGIEIPLDTIKQACSNAMVNNMLGFMLSHGDFENSHEHDYEQDDDADDDVENEDDIPEEGEGDDDDEPINNPQLLHSSLINALATTLLQGGENPNNSNNSILNAFIHHINNLANSSNQSQANQVQVVEVDDNNINAGESNPPAQPNPEANNLINNDNQVDISGDELSDDSNEDAIDANEVDSDNHSPNLQQMASDMLYINNGSNPPVFNPPSVHFNLGTGLAGLSVLPNPVIISPNGPASNPWLNQPVTHSSLVSALNSLLSSSQFMGNGPVLINGNVMGIGNQFQDVVVSMDDKDLDKLESVKLENTLECDCSVCMGHMEKDEMVTKLKCEHTFHTECIEPYLKKYNYKCPVCRAEVGKAKYHI